MTMLQSMSNVLVFAMLGSPIRAQLASMASFDSSSAQNDRSGLLRGSLAYASEWTPSSAIDGQQVVDPTSDEDFLQEVEAALGAAIPDGKAKRFKAIVEALHPTYDALEKNEYGKLSHTAVRYALHRLFVARHGWVIKGLDPAGDHFNSSSPVEVFNGKVPARVQGLFEKRLGGKGFGLQELAAFASLLEGLISQEIGDRLSAVFKSLDLRPVAAVGDRTEKVVLEVYVSAFILGTDLSNASTDQLLADRDLMPEIYAAWGDVKKLLKAIRAEVLGSKTRIKFSDIKFVLETFGERFGHWQNSECQHQKQRLMNLEVGDAGCVPLTSFYKPALRSNGSDWQFAETPNT
jgi:hypothetical protein